MTAPAGAAGRVVALDPGEARIGVAVSDASRTMAFPRPPVAAGDGAVAAIAALVTEESATCVVVGHPRRLDGTSGSAAARAEALADAVAAALDDAVTVVLHDERLTTVTATSRLRDAGVSSREARGRVDGGAAVVLLESWLGA